MEPFVDIIPDAEPDRRAQDHGNADRAQSREARIVPEFFLVFFHEADDSGIVFNREEI
jgi:hypothetical protein